MTRLLFDVLTRTTLGLLAVAAVPAMAHEVGSQEEILQAFSWDFSKAEIKTVRVTDNLHVLFGLGGNIAVQTGDDGALIVDDQFPQLMPKIRKAMRRIGAKDVDFIVNTHWHFDHADGNLALGKDDNTWIVAQSNSRRMMRDDHTINLVMARMVQKAYPEHALPNLTFDEAMQFHFNGERVDLLHFGPAHTTGDTAIIFRGNNAVHLGDVFNNSGFPFIDADNGGSIDGIIAFCSETLAQIDETTIVIPGHGEVTDHARLAGYVQMLQTVRERIAQEIHRGGDLASVIASKPTRGFDQSWGFSDDPTAAEPFINRAYHSLLRTIGEQ